MNFHTTNRFFRTVGSGGGVALAAVLLVAASATPHATKHSAADPRVMRPATPTSLHRWVPTDTTTVISTTYTTSNGSEQHFVTPFTTQPDPNRQYLIQVTKGAVSLSKADVLFNRWKAASVGDLSGGSVTRVVNALAADTIDVRVAGSAGANITVALKSVSNPTYKIRGPKRYTKSSQFQADTFTVAIPPAASPFYAYVINGPNGTRANSLELKLNGTSLTVPAEFGTALPGFVLSLTLTNGQNILSAKVGGANGATVDITTVATDNIPPLLTITTPVPNVVTSASSIAFTGTVADSTLDWVRINGLDVWHITAGAYNRTMDLVEGVNVFTVHAFDRAGYATDSTRTVTRDTGSPTLNVLVPADGLITADANLAVSGTLHDATAVTVTVNGSPLTVQNGTFSGTVALSMGTNVLSFTATDAAGNATTVVRTVTRSNTPLPPDPATVAPALDRTIATTLFAATQFLYTGANPIQTGLSGGAIDPTRVSVLKGKVKTRTGTALSGVEISILDHTELGRTYSRADGAFDIAVNGGGLTSVNYIKGGYLPVQRSIDATQQQFEVLDDVIMIPVDTAVTVVDFSTPMTVHRAATVSDSDGTRRATLLFPQGTQVTMVNADGSSQSLSSITVRATEYTVGSNGLQAMPGLLPPTSGYTYAVELSADEALAVGARSVQFSKAVPVYIENFLGFPIGTRVPVGSFEASKAAWVPMSDGMVIRVTSIAGGIASISVDTSGTVADSATLAALGITAAERQTLATLYTPGQSLWRMPVTHFSPIDGNFPSGPPAGSTAPASTQPDPKDNCATERGGFSVIECTTQVVGEDLALTGAPFRLAYRSNRVPGYLAAYRQRVRLTNATLPPNIQRVDVEFSVAGRKTLQSFSPSANLMTTFAWDGKDAYGRRVQGRQQLIVRVGYVYARLFLVPATEATTFGLNCYGSPSAPADVSVCELPQSPNPLLDVRRRVSLSREYQFMIGTEDLESDQQGAWSVDIHHVFDPVDRVLHLGDGRRRDAQDILSTIAGTGVIGFSGDGGPATQALISDPSGLAVGPDGSVYFHDGSRRIRRVTSNGVISTIAGNGTYGYSPDGTLATQAALGTVIPDRVDIAVGPDGLVYFVETGLGLVRRIAADGTLQTVAGDRTIAFCTGDNEPVDSLATRLACVKDGGPATQASLWGPYGIAVGPDGTLYIGDGSHMVRKVSPDGIITTMAGGGHASYPCDYGSVPYWGSPPNCGEGRLARQAGFDVPWDLALGPDGSLYVTDANPAIRRIGVDGLVTRVAGTGVTGYSGDGGPATAAQIRGGDGIAVGPDGSLYIADGIRIRRIAPSGVITTIAGGGTPIQCGQANPPTCTTNELAAQASFSLTGRIAVGPDGSVYLGTFAGDNRVRRITPFFRRYDATGITIASEDGSEVYEFDPSGRHLRTRDALTASVLFAFGYDSVGRLTSVTDADDNVTMLERNGSGVLTAIVSPFGQRTTITLDTRGYLATVSNPAGEVMTAGHDTLGLLRTLQDAKNNPPTRFSYDSLGLLVRDSSANGSFYTLARTETDTSVAVTLTSAMNRTQTFQRIRLPNGNVRRLETDQAGLTTRRDEQADGTTIVTSPDSTVSTVRDKNDPRFGMQAPFTGSFSVALPSGLTLAGTSKRTVTLSTANDPLSLTSQIDSLTLNGRTFTSTFDSSTSSLTVRSALGRQAVTVLDSTGRVIEERVTGVAPVKYTYGARGFLTDVRQAGRVLHYDYDSTGRVKKVTDPLGRTEQFLYDSVGRVKTQTLPDGRSIVYAYDANGNLTSLTPPTKPAHTFLYTVGDQDSIYSPPAAGLSSFKTKYLYNLDRQLTQITRADSLTIAIGYDNAGRPNGLTLPNGTVTFGYHTTSGLLNSLSSATGGSLAYTYDGALPTLATWTGTVAGSVGYTYDNNFRVTALTVNGANSIGLGYDNDNLLTSAGSLTLSRSSQNGRLTGMSLGSVATTVTYDDSIGTLKRSTATYSGNTLLDFQYTRDTLDRITQIVENVQGTTQTWAYAYDSVGRLDQVRLNGALVSDYAYDGNGNRAGLTTQSGSITGTVDDQDRLLTYGANNYTYTSNGELTRKVIGTDTTRYTYDVLGNLLQAKLANGTQIDFLVDGQNRRIGKKVNGVLTQGFVYQGQLAPIAELDGANQVVSRFVFGGRNNVPEYMIKAGVTYRILTDHLGSVRLVVNTNTGAVMQRIDYDAFGQVAQNTNPGFQPFGYAGGIYDSDVKLVRFGVRDLDVETGRWTTKDPVRFAEGSNLYEYSKSDPINWSDPSGLAPISDCLKAILKPYFPTIDLDDVELVPGIPNVVQWAATHLGGIIPIGFTWDHTISLAPEPFNGAEPLDQAGLLAHELQHVVQFQQVGTFYMSILYIADWVMNSYENSALEWAANQVEKRVLADLMRRFPNGYPCKKDCIK